MRGLALPDGKPLTIRRRGARRRARLRVRRRARRHRAHPARISWHDALNALAWLAFPRTKGALNARHVRRPGERHAPTRARRGRDAATLLDESGLILACGDPELARTAARACMAGAVRRTPRRGGAARCVPFAIGHGMLVKLLAPFRAITAPDADPAHRRGSAAARTPLARRASMRPRRARHRRRAHCGRRCCRRCRWRRCPAGTARDWARGSFDDRSVFRPDASAADCRRTAGRFAHVLRFPNRERLSRRCRRARAARRRVRRVRRVRNAARRRRRALVRLVRVRSGPVRRAGVLALLSPFGRALCSSAWRCWRSRPTRTTCVFVLPAGRRRRAHLSAQAVLSISRSSPPACSPASWFARAPRADADAGEPGRHRAATIAASTAAAPPAPRRSRRRPPARRASRSPTARRPQRAPFMRAARMSCARSPIMIARSGSRCSRRDEVREQLHLVVEARRPGRRRRCRARCSEKPNSVHDPPRVDLGLRRAYDTCAPCRRRARRARSDMPSYTTFSRQPTSAKRSR